MSEASSHPSTPPHSRLRSRRKNYQYVSHSIRTKNVYHGKRASPMSPPGHVTSPSPGGSKPALKPKPGRVSNTVEGMEFKFDPVFIAKLNQAGLGNRGNKRNSRPPISPKPRLLTDNKSNNAQADGEKRCSITEIKEMFEGDSARSSLERIKEHFESRTAVNTKSSAANQGISNRSSAGPKPSVRRGKVASKSSDPEKPRITSPVSEFKNKFQMASVSNQAQQIVKSAGLGDQVGAVSNSTDFHTTHKEETHDSFSVMKRAPVAKPRNSLHKKEPLTQAKLNISLDPKLVEKFQSQENKSSAAAVREKPILRPKPNGNDIKARISDFSRNSSDSSGAFNTQKNSLTDMGDSSRNPRVSQVSQLKEQFLQGAAQKPNIPTKTNNITSKSSGITTKNGDITTKNGDITTKNSDITAPPSHQHSSHSKDKSKPTAQPAKESRRDSDNKRESKTFHVLPKPHQVNRSPRDNSYAYDDVVLTFPTRSNPEEAQSRNGRLPLTMDRERADSWSSACSDDGRPFTATFAPGGKDSGSDNQSQEADEGWIDEEVIEDNTTMHILPVTRKKKSTTLRRRVLKQLHLQFENINQRKRASLNRQSTKTRECRRKSLPRQRYLSDPLKHAQSETVVVEDIYDDNEIIPQGEEEWESASDDGYEEIDEEDGPVELTGFKKLTSYDGCSETSESRISEEIVLLPTRKETAKVSPKLMSKFKSKINKAASHFTIATKHLRKDLKISSDDYSIGMGKQNNKHLEHSHSVACLDSWEESHEVVPPEQNSPVIIVPHKGPISPPIPRRVEKPKPIPASRGKPRSDSDTDQYNTFQDFTAGSASSDISGNFDSKGIPDITGSPPVPPRLTKPRGVTMATVHGHLNNQETRNSRAQSFDVDSSHLKASHIGEQGKARSAEDIATQYDTRPPPPLPRSGPPKPPRSDQNEEANNFVAGGGDSSYAGVDRDGYELVTLPAPGAVRMRHKAALISKDERARFSFPAARSSPLENKEDKSRDADSRGRYVKKENTRPSSRPKLTKHGSDLSTTSSASYITEDDLASVPKRLQEFDDERRISETGSASYLTLESDPEPRPLSRSRASSRFSSEPLYQMYNQDFIKRNTLDRKMKMPTHAEEDSDEESSDNDLYDDTEIGPLSHNSSTSEDAYSYDQAEDVRKSQASESSQHTSKLYAKTSTGTRTLWCEMPEVKNSGVLERMSSTERKLQEAIFEVITSEASYLKSLDLLVEHFMNAEAFNAEHSMKCVLERRDRHVLFSNIKAVRDVSEKFMEDLEDTWKKSIHLTDLCDVITHHAEKNFQVYVTYCSNQMYQDRTLKKLQKENLEFVEELRRLESDRECQGLNMNSFLLLPMQRITRLPLLIDAIHHRMESGTKEHQAALHAHGVLQKLVKDCNEGARKMERTEEMCNISNQLQFAKVKKKLALISTSRYLVKQGNLARIVWEQPSRFSLGKPKPTKQTLYFFLFNDLLLVTKKKGDEYSVIDHAQRSQIHLEDVQLDAMQKDHRLPYGIPVGCDHLFILVLLSNHEGKNVEMVISCESVSEKQRWMDALSSSHDECDDEKIYEAWDCPQVQAIHPYTAQQHDELTLEECDVINVHKKMADGWYEGERIRDGEHGWFPSSYTMEIVSEHLRAKNLKMRYRLMVVSKAMYDEQHQKEKKDKDKKDKKGKK